jgi:thiol:disulfide interchange protein DsbC
MRILLLAVAMMISTMASAAGNANDSKAVTDKINKAFPNMKIDEIRKAPIAGLYEIRVGKDVFYSDLTGEHVLFGGQIVETASRRNLTRERMQEFNRIDWSILPLDKAIVSGDKDAELKVAVFSDPDCHFCKKLEEELKHTKGIKVYTFLYPLPMHPDARGKAEAIWCSENRHETMLKVMLDRANPQVEKCNTPLDEILELGKKLNVTGTPTLFSGDGRMSAGWKTADQLKKWLSNK